MEYAVRMKQITKKFSKVTANDHVDFDVRKGEIHALVGENGAGKSTLMNTLYGLYIPDGGEIEVNGTAVHMHSALDGIKCGIGMVHQHFMLIPRLTVVENIVLGEEPRKHKIFFDYKEGVKKVNEVSRAYGLSVDSEAIVGNVSLGMQQRIEILKTLYRGAEIIILDEPTAVLTPQEIEELGEILQRLKKMGKTVIIITHKIEEIMNFSDRITVLRMGKNAGSVVTNEITVSDITKMMVGKDISLGGQKQEVSFEGNMLEVRNLTYQKDGREILKDISFTLKKGEILGVSGIDGSGQTELAEVICGVCKAEKGTVCYDGENINDRTIADRKKAGIAFIPQDRHKDGLVLDFSITDNLLLGFQRSNEFLQGRIQMDQKAIKKNAREKIAAFDIRTPSADQPAYTLSGGNQQKIIVARELGGDSRLIVADQPTRGVDVGAIEFIHNVLTEKRNCGCGVLLVSLELDELLMISDRIMVLNEGKIAGIVNPRETTKEEIGLLMVGQGTKGEAVTHEN